MAETNEKLKVKRGKSDALPTEIESGSLIFETDTGTAYVDADDERIQIVDPTKLSLTGGTMEGDIDMGDNNITTTHVPEDDADVANKKYVDEHSGGGEGGSYFAVCDSESDVQDKTADCDGFTLTDGVSVNVKFTNTNTAETPTLNINNTGSKQIVFQNKEIIATGLVADTIYTFVYDGTDYNVVSGSLNRVDSVDDDNITFRNIVVIESDELANDVDAPVGSIILQKVPTGLSEVYWGRCSTLGSTSTKIVSCDGFILKDGSTIHVYFVNTNTASSLSLNINGTGELSIYSEGSQVTSGTFSEGITYTFVYHDGYYELLRG